MAKGKTTTTKGVIFVDKEGKRHVLNREEFARLIKKLANKAKVNHSIRVIEESEVES